jgi:hypothetical protein
LPARPEAGRIFEVLGHIEAGIAMGNLGRTLGSVSQNIRVSSI